MSILTSIKCVVKNCLELLRAVCVICTVVRRRERSVHYFLCKLCALLFISAVQLGKTNGCKSLNSSRYIGCVSGLFGNVYSVGECLAGAHTTYIDLFQMEIVQNSYIFHKVVLKLGYMYVLK